MQKVFRSEQHNEKLLERGTEDDAKEKSREKFFVSGLVRDVTGVLWRNGDFSRTRDHRKDRKKAQFIIDVRQHCGTHASSAAASAVKTSSQTMWKMHFNELPRHVQSNEFMIAEIRMNK